MPPLPPSLLPRASVLSLYRSLLRSLAVYPSIKRSALRQAMRLDFRDGAKLTDVNRIHAEQVRAQTALSQMQQFLPRSRTPGEWEININMKPK